MRLHATPRGLLRVLPRRGARGCRSEPSWDIARRLDVLWIMRGPGIFHKGRAASTACPHFVPALMQIKTVNPLLVKYKV
jgi:hypothetical protein